MPDSCTDQHTGTSASAPIAAGIIALALEAKYAITVVYFIDLTRSLLDIFMIFLVPI